MTRYRVSGLCSAGGVAAPICRGSEVDAAAETVRIAGEYGIQLTLFVTGLAAREQPDEIRGFTEKGHVEIGGYTYFAFSPRKVFNAYFRVTGSRNGPSWFQRWEVKRTVRLLNQVTGQEIRSWRNHAYSHDKHTRRILADNGIWYLSDVLSANRGQPKRNQGVVDVPINTLPDHDYVYHGARQPGTFDETRIRNSVFRSGGITREEWLQRIKTEVRAIERAGGLSVILAHPACMEVIDNHVTFERLCRFVSGFETTKMRNIGWEWMCK